MTYKKRVAFAEDSPLTLSELREKNRDAGLTGVITKSAVDEAFSALKPYISATSVHEITSQELNALLQKLNADPLVSHELLERISRLILYTESTRLIVGDCTDRPTGSYKECGAFYAAIEAKQKDANATLITASAGNHGAGMARAAKELDMNVIIVVPTCAPDTKIDTIKRQLGIPLDMEPTESDETFRKYEIKTESGKTRTLLIQGVNFDDSNAIALGMRDRATYISPYNDPNVWKGQTYNLSSMQEGLRALGVTVETGVTRLVVPIGGGGFASGVGGYAKLLNPTLVVEGVEPETHAKFSSKIPPQHPNDLIKNPGTTLADGTATKKYGDLTYPELLRTVDHFNAVTEHDIKQAITLLYLVKGIVAEGAGALGLAMILSQQTEEFPTQRAHSGLATASAKPVTLFFVSGKNIGTTAHDDILKGFGIYTEEMLARSVAK